MAQQRPTAADSVRPFRLVLAPLARFGSEEEARARVAAILPAPAGGRRPAPLPLLRSVNSWSPVLPADSATVVLGLVPVAVDVANNSRLPFSLNDGAMWAGVGGTWQVTGGLRLAWQKLRVTLAPTFTASANQFYFLPTDGDIVPEIVPGRSEWSSPYHYFPKSIDMPRRFGDRPLQQFDLGQSSVGLAFRHVETGVAHEHRWWGPGLRNALLLSNNAPGFGHAYVRTAHPLATPLGHVSAQYFLGALTDSRFFTTELQPLRARALSGIAATLDPRGTSGLTIGIARLGLASMNDRGELLTHLLDPFTSAGRPNAVNVFAREPAGRRRDQLFSLFGRLVLPDDGAEVWAEWARAEQPVNLRDLFTSPGHSQAFTVGLQFARRLGVGRPSLAVQLEHSQTTQSGSYRDRPMGSWYTSRGVPAGFTQRGQVLGAAIGPGGQSQWLAVDVRGRSWTGGGFMGRIRWNDDAFYTISRPLGNGLCKHDVSLFGGLRGSALTRHLIATGTLAWENRLNTFWQTRGFCFDQLTKVDTRNLSFTISVAPRVRW